LDFARPCGELRAAPPLHLKAKKGSVFLDWDRVWRDTFARLKRALREHRAKLESSRGYLLEKFADSIGEKYFQYVALAMLLGFIYWITILVARIKQIRRGNIGHANYGGGMGERS